CRKIVRSNFWTPPNHVRPLISRDGNDKGQAQPAPCCSLFLCRNTYRKPDSRNISSSSSLLMLFPLPEELLPGRLLSSREDEPCRTLFLRLPLGGAGTCPLLFIVSLSKYLSEAGQPEHLE